MFSRSKYIDLALRSQIAAIKAKDQGTKNRLIALAAYWSQRILDTTPAPSHA